MSWRGQKQCLIAQGKASAVVMRKDAHSVMTIRRQTYARSPRLCHARRSCQSKVLKASSLWCLRAIASSSLGKRASKSGSLVVNGENLYSDEESTDTEQSSQMQIDDWYQDEWIASVMKVHAENPTTSFLSELHSRSKNALYKATFPTRKLESYRFTDLSFLQTLRPSTIPAPDVEFLKTIVDDARATESETVSLVLVDGVFVESLSSLKDVRSSVKIRSKLNNQQNDPRQSLACGSIQNSSKSSTLFSHLNGACAKDFVSIEIADDAAVDNIIQIVYISTSSNENANCETPLSFPRGIIRVGSGASCSILETFVSASSSGSSSNALHVSFPVLEISLGLGAELRHDYSQQISREAYHIRQTYVKQSQQSKYVFAGVDTGSKVCRHDLSVGQDGPETSTNLYTFAMVNENQVIDLHSDIDLEYPSSKTEQLHKCIASHSSSRGVFDGCVHVRKEAQQTDAGQLCRSLLLDRNATVNVKPNLRIHADDVKCTHGATISDLEEEQLFYLRSRGITNEDARRTLIYSFGFDVVGRMLSESTKKRIATQLAETCKMSDLES